VNQFRLSLLGLFEASLDDGPLTGLRSSKGRGLLAFLASRPGFPHLRETLATLLWGEATDEAARLSLRVALSNMRAALGPLQNAPHVHPLLETTRHHVRFNADPACCWIDAVEFDALLAACAAHTHVAVERCPACIERLSQAVNLYRGDFLADLIFPDSPAFDEWRVLQQERYHRQTLTALGHIAHYHLALGEHSAAQAASRRQLDLEPWHEEAHRLLMRSLALDGQRHAALAQYEAAQRILASELGAEPEPETHAVYAQILAGTTQNGGVAPSNRAVNRSPAQLTPFVGRDCELRHIGELLGDPACRLLTLIGPGGIGKTRLAQEAITHYSCLFPDGACYLSLGFAETPEALSLAVAEAMRVPLAQADEPALTTLTLHLRQKTLLVVLDDCQPTPAAADWLINFMRGAPGLKLVVISHQRLNVRGEWLLRLDGLNYGCACNAGVQAGDEALVPGEAGLSFDAVSLFSACAQRNSSGWQLDAKQLAPVARICELVQGMPLAIELATAWLPVLSCAEIAAEIENNLDFLASSLADVPQRQRSLRVVFQQAWDLLAPAEQAVFARLAIFSGTFDRVAAEAVAGAPLAILAALADRALLVCDGNGNGNPRFALHAVLRQYAREELVRLAGEPSDVAQRHARYFLGFLSQQADVLEGTNQTAALAAIAGQIADVRVAWKWAVANGAIQQLDAAWYALFTFYNVRSWFREGEAAFHHLAEMLRRRQAIAGLASQTLLGLALAGQAWFIGQAGRLAEADQLMQEGVMLLRSQDAPDALAFALGRQGALALHGGEYHEAWRLCRESLDLYCLTGNRIGMATLHGFMAQLAFEQGQYDEVKRHSLTSLELARRQGNRWRVAFPLSHLANVAVVRGDFDRGQALLAEALAIRQERSDQRGVAMTHLDLGNLDMARGDPAGARRHYGRALEIFWRLGYCQGLARVLLQISTALAAAGQSDEGLLLLALLREQGEALQRFHEPVERQYAVLAGQMPPARLGALLAQARATSLDTAIQRHVKST
jgi:predicted ATPase/DNA-binding SARP family transcriptional activator